MSAQSWEPPFCPNPQCESHKNLLDSQLFIRKGTFYTNHSGRIQRFRCSTCGKNMSRSTFDVEFRAKLRMDLPDIADALCTGVGIRAIARKHGVGTSPIINRAKRLGRQAISLQTTARENFILSENLVADGLESFAWSQYFPNHHTILVGAKSQYCYLADFAVMRRKGSMTITQKKRRSELDHSCIFPRGSVKNSFKRILYLVHDLCSKSTEHFELHTDEHPRYQEAFLELKQTERAKGKPLNFSSRTTSSKLLRTLDNPLFAVNYFDREIRKDQANHTRETTQWSHDANSSMNRFYVYMTMHNFIKNYRIRGKELRSHAEVAGVDMALCKDVHKHLFEVRAFLTRLPGITESESNTWFLKWPNPWTKKHAKVWPYMYA